MSVLRLDLQGSTRHTTQRHTIIEDGATVLLTVPGRYYVTLLTLTSARTPVVKQALRQILPNSVRIHG
jgi:hypothetical protein